MRQLRQLSTILDALPVWCQILIAAGLVVYAIVSLYARINVTFGARVFSKVPSDQIRTNVPHIIRYTVAPVIVTIGYLVMLIARHTS
jgi:hypothetical protein